MDRRGRTDEGENAPGRRLERYVKGRWTRRNGGMVQLAKDIGSSTETMYSWFRGETEPNMNHLRALADKLGVRRAVLVAVLDGDPLPGESEAPPGLEPRLRAIEAAVALLAERGGVALPAPSVPRERVG